MAAPLVYAYVLYNGTSASPVPDYTTVTINCDRLQSYSPRPVWLVRELAPGDGTTILWVPTFSPTSDQLLDPNTIPGLWLEVDGQDVVIDVQNQNPTTFNTACNACCGSVPTIVASNYNGLVPAFTPLTINTFCIYRNNTGSAGDHDAFSDDYVGTTIGSVVQARYFSNTSQYTIQSYYTLAQFTKLLKQGDTIYAGACL